MKCQNREEKISLYMDKQLNWKEEKEFLEHVRHCEDCRKALEEAKLLREILQELPEEELPEGLHESILKGLQKEMAVIPLTKKKGNNKKQWYGAIAAAIVLLGVAGSGIYTMVEQRQNQTALTMPTETAEEPVEEMTPKETTTVLSNGTIPETAKAIPYKTEADTAEQTSEDTGEVPPPEDTEVPTEETEEPLSAAAQETSADVSQQKNTEKTSVTETEEGENILESRAMLGASPKRSSAGFSGAMKSKTVSLQLQAKTPEDMAEKLEKQAAAWGGGVEVPYQEGGSITIKVPMNNYDTALSWIEKQGKISGKEETVEDLSKQYQEIQEQAEEAAQKEEEAKEKGYEKAAQNARAEQKECERALEALEETAEFATIQIALTTL